jgi:hypothetical protein
MPCSKVRCLCDVLFIMCAFYKVTVLKELMCVSYDAWGSGRVCKEHFCPFYVYIWYGVRAHFCVVQMEFGRVA